jgi:peroxiredoxin
MTTKAQNYPSAKDLKGIEVGQMIENFEALDQDNQLFKLDEALKKGPVVLIFYRGYWCPVCNKHLKLVQDSLTQIEEMGATVVAISPEKPEYLDKMAEKTGAKFTLLYDEGYKISDAFKVTFRPDSGTLVLYNTILRAKLKDTHSDDSQRLPIPATFIIGKDSKVIWRQFDPDYKKRSSVNEILYQLSILK